jgi:hypothetical protein
LIEEETQIFSEDWEGLLGLGLFRVIRVIHGFKIYIGLDGILCHINSKLQSLCRVS